MPGVLVKCAGIGFEIPAKGVAGTERVVMDIESGGPRGEPRRELGGWIWAVSTWPWEGRWGVAEAETVPPSLLLDRSLMLKIGLVETRRPSRTKGSGRGDSENCGHSEGFGGSPARPITALREGAWDKAARSKAAEEADS